MGKSNFAISVFPANLSVQRAMPIPLLEHRITWLYAYLHLFVQRPFVDRITSPSEFKDIHIPSPPTFGLLESLSLKLLNTASHSGMKPTVVGALA